MSPKSKKSTRKRRQSGGALPAWLQNVMNGVFGTTTTTIPRTTTIPPVTPINQTAYSSFAPAITQYAPPGTPVGSIVNSDGSIVDPVSGLILSGRGSTSAPVGSTVSSAGTIIPPVTSAAPIGRVSASIPVGSIVLTDGSIRSPFTGVQYAGPGTTIAPPGSLIVSGGLIVAVSSTSGYTMLGTAPVGIPGGSIVNSDGSITNPINGNIVAPVGTSRAPANSVVMKSGAIVAPNATTIASEIAVNTLARTTTMPAVPPSGQMQPPPGQMQPPPPGPSTGLNPPRLPGNGTSGPTGSTGPTGNAGLVGVPGPTGNAGLVGVPGSTGPTGPSDTPGQILTFAIPRFTGENSTATTSTAGKYAIKKIDKAESTAGAYSNETVTPNISTKTGIFLKSRCALNGGNRNSAVIGFTDRPSMTNTPDIRYGFILSSLNSSDVGISPDKSKVSIMWERTPIPIDEAYIGLTTISPPAVYVSPSDTLLISYDSVHFKFYINDVIIAKHPFTMVPAIPLHFSGFIRTSANNSIKEPAILDIQMGTYNTQKMFDIMLGGKRPKKVKQMGGNALPDWLANAIASATAGLPANPTLTTSVDLTGTSGVSQVDLTGTSGVSQVDLTGSTGPSSIDLIGPTGPSSLDLTGPTGPSTLDLTGPTGPTDHIGGSRTHQDTGHSGTHVMHLDKSMPIVGNQLTWTSPSASSSATKVYNIYNDIGSASNRYTVIKTTNDSSIAGAYASPALTPSETSGVFILGRAIANAENNIATFGFGISTPPSKFDAKTLPELDISNASVQYGFYICQPTNIESVNIDSMKLQVLVAGKLVELSTEVHISPIDHLTVVFDPSTTNMNYYLNGVIIHQESVSSVIKLNSSELYGIIAISNSSASTIKQVGIVDFQMGVYDLTNFSALMIGGGKRNKSKKVYRKSR